MRFSLQVILRVILKCGDLVLKFLKKAFSFCGVSAFSQINAVMVDINSVEKLSD